MKLASASTPTPAVLLRPSDLDEAVAAGLIDSDRVAALWAFLATRGAARPTGPRFTFTNVLYYLGGMVAIGAMSIFMTLGWESFGGWGIFFISLLYGAVAWKLALGFESRGLAVPKGIMAALMVVLTPLALWGLLHALGWWADDPHATAYRQYHAYINWRWTTLELATLLAGILLLWRWRTPFLLMPVAVTLWYMSMDLVMLWMLPESDFFSPSLMEARQWFSLGFGLVMLLLAFAVDLRTRLSQDYAFWLYLFGLLTFWGALSSMGSGELSGKLVYLTINLGLVALGALLVRRSFTVFGALGVAIVLSDLSWRYFRDSWLFPIALSAIGLALVYLGVWWSRHEAELGARLRSWLPAELCELIRVRREQV